MMGIENLLSKKVRNIEESQLTKWDGEVQGLLATHPELLLFNVGQPDFPLARFVNESTKAQVEKGNSRYTNVAGMLDVRRAVSFHMQRVYGLDYDPEQIILTVGAKEGVSLSLTSLLNPGDEVLINGPAWGTYADMVKLLEGIPVIVEAREDFSPDLVGLEGAITPRTKAIIVNNPCNPTGYVWTQEEREALAQIAIEHDLVVIADEVYERVSLTGAEPCSMAGIEGMQERTIVINGFSKSLAMTGWRIGFVCADRGVIAAIKKLKSLSNGNQNSLMQALTEDVLCQKFFQMDRFIAINNAEYRRRKERICGFLQELGIEYVEPQGAFYVFFKIPDRYKMGSVEFARRLIDKFGIALAPGIFFGEKYDRYQRLSFATSMANIEEAIGRIKEHESTR